MFYKYMTILHSTPLPWVTFVLQVHPHTALSVTVVDRTTSRTSPHSTLSHCLGLHFFYKYSILLFTSLSWVMFLLQVHNHTALYVTALCPISVANTPPYSTLRHCPVPHFDTLRHWPRFLCKHITIAYSTSLRITSSTSASLYCKPPPVVKHFTSASPYSNLRDCHWSHFATSTSPYSMSFLISLHQIFSTSASPYCTLCPLFWSPCYKYITIFYFAHTSSTTTSPLRKLRHFPGPHFY